MHGALVRAGSAVDCINGNVGFVQKNFRPAEIEMAGCSATQFIFHMTNVLKGHHPLRKKPFTLTCFYLAKSFHTETSELCK